MLYASQDDWRSAGDTGAIVDGMRRAGRLAGMDDETMNACLQDSDNLRTLVAWYQQNAEADGINSTPSFVINGTTYNNMNYDEMARLIDEAAGS